MRLVYNCIINVKLNFMIVYECHCTFLHLHEASSLNHFTLGNMS